MASVAIAAGVTTQALTPSYWSGDATDTFYSATVGRGAVGLAPSLFTNTNDLDNDHTLTSVKNLAPDQYTNDATFNSHVLAVGAVDVAPDGAYDSSADTIFFTSTLTLYLTPDLYDSSADIVFYEPTVDRGTVALAPTLFTNDADFYVHVVTVGAVDVAPDDVYDSAADTTFYTATIVSLVAPEFFNNVVNHQFYTAVLGGGGLDLQPDGIFTNGANFYTHTITTGGVDVAPDDLYDASDDAVFYTATLKLYLAPGLFNSAASSTFYSHAISVGAANLAPQLYDNSADVFNAHAITVGAVTLLPPFHDGAVTDTFYAATVVPGAVNLVPALYSDADTFYIHALAATYTLLPELVDDTADVFVPLIVSLDPTRLFPPLVEETTIFEPTVRLSNPWAVVAKQNEIWTIVGE